MQIYNYFFTIGNDTCKSPDENNKALQQVFLLPTIYDIVDDLRKRARGGYTIQFHNITSITICSVRRRVN